MNPVSLAGFVTPIFWAPAWNLGWRRAPALCDRGHPESAVAPLSLTANYQFFLHPTYNQDAHFAPIITLGL
jgi:hypothetical protein